MASSPDAIGVKGSDVYSTTGSALLDLSVLLVRGADKDATQIQLLKALEAPSPEKVDDAFVLAFQTRDVRGGKGERELFFYLFTVLLENYHKLAIPLLDFVPEYGCWRDIFKLLEMSRTPGGPPGLQVALVDLVKIQLMKDQKALAEGKSVSLMAKWAPRESGADQELARFLAKELYPAVPSVSQRMAMYRKAISALNKAADTVEVKMCAGQWDTIEPAKVPGLALAKHMKAYLNEVASKKKDEPVAAGALRHPDDPVRMACREHFKSHLAKAAAGGAKINGAVVRYPHDIIKKVVKGGRRGASHCYCEADDCAGCEESSASISEAERNSLIAVWNDMVKMARASGGLKRSLAMCDFSGSMQSSGVNGDTPYWVSMAMGLLIAEAGSDTFKDTFLTFDSNPTFHHLPEGDIFKRVQSINGYIGQGTSTDFQKAMDAVLARLVETRCPPGEEPRDLIVITDMNFDAACPSHMASSYTGNRYRRVVKTAERQTHAQMAREAFRRASEDVFGPGVKGWEPPRIVIWNVAAGASDFQAQAEEEGVIHLSGWSPSLFKVLLEEGAKVLTPMDALRVMLDADRYQPIRERLAAVRASGL